ncbi:MAG: ABC transporter permease [Bryobacterales bacterium]|nr:ABC transporter permease [Bryobacterales bacterium]
MLDTIPFTLSGGEATAEYFQVFGVQAQLGRTFLPADEQPGAPRVVVLTHAVWRNELGGDPSIVGRLLRLDGEPHEVVGVLPPTAFDRSPARFWRPLVFDPEQRRRDFHWLSVNGRLRSGVSLEQAREEMRRIEASLEEVTPAYKREWAIVVEPLASLLVGRGLKTVLAGIALGLLGTFVATRALESLLFEVSALDPWSLGAACAAVALIGFAAGLLPARRAARVSPATALREE